MKRRVLLSHNNEKMTDGIMVRRAQQIAAEIISPKVEVEKGSEPNGRPWRFHFYDNNGGVDLVLEVRGTRGAVYTALGNYLAGLMYDGE